jgi:O-antigen/teichoic acid export membrane protein
MTARAERTLRTLTHRPGPSDNKRVASLADPPLPPGEPERKPSTAASVAYTFSTQVAAAVLSLGNVLIVARGLGPSGRGDVVFLITIAILSSQFASLSISESISIFAGRRPGQRPALAGNAVVLAATLGLAAVGVLVLLMIGFPGISPPVGPGLKALALAVVAPLILQEYLSRLAMAEYRFAIANVSFIVPAVVQIVLNALLYATGDLTVATAMLAWVAGWLVSLAVLLWGVGVRGAGFGRPNARLGSRMIAFGLKAHGSRSLTWGNFRLDQWLVGALAGTRELGLYSVAVAWAEGLFLLPQAIAIVQRPDLVREDTEAAGRRAATGFRLAMLASAPVVVGLVVLAPLLCTGFFGARFAGSVDQLRVLAIGGFGILAVKVFGSALIAQRRPWLETIATAGAFVVTLVLDLVLIPSLGGLGAAVASTVSYTIGGALVILIAARTLRFCAGDLAPALADLRAVRGNMLVLCRRAT